MRGWGEQVAGTSTKEWAWTSCRWTQMNTQTSKQAHTQAGMSKHAGTTGTSSMIGATATNKCRQATMAPAAATAANTNERGWEGQMGSRAGEYEQRQIEWMQASNSRTSSSHYSRKHKWRQAGGANAIEAWGIQTKANRTNTCKQRWDQLQTWTHTQTLAIHATPAGAAPAPAPAAATVGVGVVAVRASTHKREGGQCERVWASRPKAQWGWLQHQQGFPLPPTLFYLFIHLASVSSSCLTVSPPPFVLCNILQ